MLPSRLSQLRTSPKQQALACLIIAILLGPGGLFFTAVTVPSIESPSQLEGLQNQSYLIGVQGGPAYERTASGDVLWSDSRPEHTHYEVDELPNGSVLITESFPETQDCGQFDAPCYRAGVRLLSESGDETLFTWSYPVRNRGDSQLHAADWLGDEVLIADMEHETVFTVDVSTGEKTWTWNASSRYDAPDDPTTEDWLHINDVDQIGDGRYMVSVRNKNEILILNRGEGVEEVINDGGRASVLRHQHNPQWLGPNAVLVADSGNDRVVELHKNENGRWEVQWAVYQVGGQNLHWPRDADRLPNGLTVITDTRNQRIVVVNESARAVASYHLDHDLPYEADIRGIGEPVGGPTYSSHAQSRSQGPELPGFETALGWLHHLTSIPYWVSGFHLAGILLSIVFVGVGVQRGYTSWKTE